MHQADSNQTWRYETPERYPRDFHTDVSSHFVLFPLRLEIFFPLVDTQVWGKARSHKELDHNCRETDEAEKCRFSPENSE